MLFLSHMGASRFIMRAFALLRYLTFVCMCLSCNSSTKATYSYVAFVQVWICEITHIVRIHTFVKSQIVRLHTKTIVSPQMTPKMTAIHHAAINC